MGDHRPEFEGYKLMCKVAGLPKSKLKQKPDPYLVFAWVPSATLLWKTEIADRRTDTIYDPFILDVSRIVPFSLDSAVRVSCMDYNNGDPELIGEFEAPLSALLRVGYEAPLINPTKAKAFRIRGKYKDSGKVIVDDVIPLDTFNGHIPKHKPWGLEFTFSAEKLDRNGLKSDPFLIVKNKLYKRVAITEVVEGTLNPTWNPLILSLQELHVMAFGGGSMYQSLDVEVWDFQKDGRHELIGERANILLDEVLCSARPRYSLVNFKKKARTVPIASDLSKEVTGKQLKVPYQNSGILHVQKVRWLASDPRPPSPASAYKFRFVGASLDRKDINLRSDPYFVIKLKNAKSRIVYKSDVVKKSINPDWEEFVLNVADVGDFNTTVLDIECWNFSSKAKHGFIGHFEATLNDLTNRNFPYFFFYNEAVTAVLRSGPRFCGRLTVVKAEPTEEIQLEIPESFLFTFCAKDLDRKEMLGLGKSDSYFRIMEGYRTLYQSEHIPKNSNPHWKPFDLTTAACGALTNELVVEVWNWDAKNPEIIGSFKTTLQELADNSTDQEFPIVNSLKEKRVVYRNSGIVRVLECTPIYAEKQEALKNSGKSLDRTASKAAINFSRFGFTNHEQRILHDQERLYDLAQAREKAEQARKEKREKQPEKEKEKEWDSEDSDDEIIFDPTRMHEAPITGVQQQQPLPGFAPYPQPQSPQGTPSVPPHFQQHQGPFQQQPQQTQQGQPPSPFYPPFNPYMYQYQPQQTQTSQQDQQPPQGSPSVPPHQHQGQQQLPPQQQGVPPFSGYPGYPPMMYPPQYGYYPPYMGSPAQPQQGIVCQICSQVGHIARFCPTMQQQQQPQQTTQQHGQQPPPTTGGVPLDEMLARMGWQHGQGN